MQDVIDFNLLKEYDTTLKDILGVWTKQKAYSLGDKVKYKGHLLECTTAGTSGTTTLNFTNLDIGDTINDGTVVWELVEEESSGKGIDFYTVGESYNVNDIVIYNGNIYQCITAHTATSTFDSAKWTEISASGGVDLPEWQANTQYKAGKYLVHEGTVYKVDNDFTSGTTFSDTNLTAYIAPIMQGATSSANGKSGIVPKPTSTDVDKFLKGDGTWGSAGGGISIWQANTSYNVNDVVIDSNLIWQCATSHTSTTIFDESKWVCISGGEISNGMEIVTLYEGEFSFDNSTQGPWPTSSTTMMELSESIDNFEHIYVTTCTDSRNNNVSTIVPVSSFNNDKSMRVGMYESTSQSYNIEIVKYDNTHLAIIYKAMAGWTSGYVKSVRGIRKAKPIVSSGMKYETLWEGEAGSLSGSGSTTINLSEPVDKYKKIGLCLSSHDNSSHYRRYYVEVDTNEYINLITNGNSGDSMAYGFQQNVAYYFELTYGGTNQQFAIDYNHNIITKVIGISEGVQIPTGVQAARVTLWEGLYNTVNSPLQLSDSIENYDQFEIILSNDEGDEHGLFVYDVSSIVYNRSSVFRAYNGRDTTYRYSVGFGFADSSNIVLNSVVVSGWPDCYLTKITGIKYIQPDSYSTEEKLIGTWIDGKPLYRKVFTGLNISLEWNGNLFAWKGDVSLPINNIDTIVKSIGYGTNFCMPVTLQLNSSNNLFSIRGVDVWTINKLVIEYTKN